MSDKYFEISDENEKLFNKVLKSTSIPHWVEFQLLGNNSLKGLYTVRKLNDFYEFLTNGKNIIIVLNEEIFDNLDDELKEISLVEALGGISVNERDKIVISKYDFETYSGLLKKYGNDVMVRYKESVHAVLKQKEDDGNNK